MADEIKFLASHFDAALAYYDETTVPYGGLWATDYDSEDYHYRNLLDDRLGSCLIVGSTGAPGQFIIKVDYGEDVTKDAVALFSCNPFTGGNDSGKWYMEVRTSTSWLFSSSTVRLAQQTPTAADEPTWYEEFTEATARYWAIYLYYYLDGVSRISTFRLGKKFAPGVPYNKPVNRSIQAGIDIVEAKGGARYGNKRHSGRNLWLPAAVTLINQTEWDALYDYLWEASDEGLHPVYFQDIDGSHWYVRVNLDGRLSWTHQVYKYFDTPLALEEEL